MPQYVQLAVRIHGVPTQVRFNGLLLCAETAGEDLHSDELLNEWIMPSGNLLSIDVTPPEKPVPTGSDVQVVVRRANEQGEEPQPAWQGFTWKFTAGEKVAPFRVTFPVVVPERIPSKVWDVALTLAEPAGEELAGAVALAQRVHAAFASADPKKVLDVLAFRASEVARFTYADPAASLADMTAAYTRILKSDGFRVDPISPAKLAFKRVCHEKLLLVTHAGGDLVQCENEDGPCLSVPVYLAKTAEGWVVAR